MHPASFLEEYRPVFNPEDMARERGLTVQWLIRDHLRETSLEPPIVRFVPQWTIQSGRRHFERVLPSKRRFAQLLVLHVEQGAQIPTHALAVLDTDRLFWGFWHATVRPVDDHSEHRADGLTSQLHVEHFEPATARHSLRGGADPSQFVMTRRKTPLKHKKWARAHSGYFLEAGTDQYNISSPLSAERRSDPIVLARLDQPGLDEVSGAELGRITIGQVDLRVDVRCVPLETAAPDQLVLRRRTVDEHGHRFTHPRPLCAFDNSLLNGHQLVPALPFGRGGDVVHERKGPRAFLMRIGEDAEMVESRVLHEIPELNKIRL